VLVAPVEAAAVLGNSAGLEEEKAQVSSSDVIVEKESALAANLTSLAPAIATEQKEKL
jgi:hypothetical protein